MLKKLFMFICIASICVMVFACGKAKDAKSDIRNDSAKSLVTKEPVAKRKDENFADRTIMYYMIGSDLEENSLCATDVIAEICKVHYPNNMNFIMMTGGARSENVEWTRQDIELKDLYSNYYNINWDKNQIWKIDNSFNLVEENFGNENMTDGKTLEKFITYVKKNYPAEKYDIIFWDHGGAGLYGFGNDTRYEEINACLSIKELIEAFKNTNIKFNTVGFDACLMASFELMYVLEPYADYLIAAEETSFGSWSYTFLEKFVKDVHMNAVEYGKLIVDAFMENNDSNANSLGIFALSGFTETIDDSLTAFSKNMNKYLVEDVYLKSIYTILKYVTGLGYVSIGDTRDLRDFLDWIGYTDNWEGEADEYEFPTELSKSAIELWNKIEQFVIYYRTHKMKYEEGEEKTGGMNFVFPATDVYYDNDDVDSALLSINNYPESLNEDFRLMYKLAFLRKALFKELKNNTYENDDNKVKNLLNDICKRGLEEYHIPKEYIDRIKNDIVPNLSVNRIKCGSEGNIDFEKNVNDKNEVTFNFKFADDVAWMIYEPVATARTYAYDGKELKLGDALISRQEIWNGKETIWTITPEEDRWFSVKSGDNEGVTEFIITEFDKKEIDPANLNYLFDKSITGFIPAVIKRYENDKAEDNIILIQVEFTGNNKEGKIVGFTRYDQNANMQAKELEEFKKEDVIYLIANFEDFKISKNISYIYYDEFDASNLIVSRGYTNSQSVYFKYSVEDIYGEIYECEVPNTFGFSLNDGTDTCLYASFPSTWTDVVINENDSSFESISAIGEHKELLKVDIYDVTNDMTNFGNVKIGEEYPESTINYLLSDNNFSQITDTANGFILSGETEYLPMLSIVGSGNSYNTISKKYVYFERNAKKYVIELSSTIDGKVNKHSSYHEMRLIRTALELVGGAGEKYDYIPVQKVEERAIIK